MFGWNHRGGGDIEGGGKKLKQEIETKMSVDAFKKTNRIMRGV
jgi:hypothetical protein